MNKSAINVSSCYRLVSFDTDDLKLVTSIYEVMYPKRQIEASHLAETIYKFGSFKTGQTCCEYFTASFQFSKFLIPFSEP